MRLLVVSVRNILLKQLIAVSHPDHNFNFSWLTSSLKFDFRHYQYILDYIKIQFLKILLDGAGSFEYSEIKFS